MANEARAVCPVCLRHICVTTTGLLRSHGPCSNHCPGSNSAAQVISQSSQSAPPPSSDETHGPSSLPQAPPFSLPQTRVPIVHRLPKGSLRLASEKLCYLLEEVVATNYLCMGEPVVIRSQLFIFTT